MCDSDGKNPNQITYIDHGENGTPSWSPDGQTIAFDSNHEVNYHIYKVNANGGNPKKVTSGKSNSNIPSWSRDGCWIYFMSDRSGDEQIWKIPMPGSDAKQITFSGGISAIEFFDGKWVYYTKGEDGYLEKIIARRRRKISYRSSSILQELGPGGGRYLLRIFSRSWS